MQIGGGASCGCAPDVGPGQVPGGRAAEPVHHAAPGPAPHQRPVQGANLFKVQSCPASGVRYASHLANILLRNMHVGT